MTAAFGSRLQIISTISTRCPTSVSKFCFPKGFGEVATELSAQRLSLLNVRSASSLTNVSQAQQSPRNHARSFRKWLPQIVASCAGIGAAFTGFGYTRSFSINASSVPEKKPKEEDLAQPSEVWSPESCTLFNKLLDELKDDDGEWEKLTGRPQTGEHKLFPRAFQGQGKMFEYALFFSKNKQKLKGVIQFGPYTQGPPGCVHGGAIATMLDSATGVCAHRSGYLCVTANLSTNYKKLIPLGATVLVESQVDRVEGRKVYLSASLKSSDGSTIHSTATALFIMPVDREKYERLDNSSKS